MNNNDYLNKENFLSVACTNQMKGISILLVLLGHLRIIPNAGAWGVTLFLILSGFGLTQSYFKKGLEGFFKKKIIKIIFPYTIVTVLWLAIDYIIYHKSYNIPTVLLSLVGLDVKSNVDATMWYVTFLLLWYIIFYLVFSLRVKNIVKISLLLLASVIFIIFRDLFSESSGVALYVFAFPLGVMISLNYSKIKKINSRYFNKMLLILGIVSVVIFVVTVGQSNHNPIFYLLANHGFAIGCMVGMILITNKGIESRTLMFIGSISYEIYLLEGAFLFKYNFLLNISNNRYIVALVFITFIIVLATIYNKALKSSTTRKIKLSTL